ncbi:alpha-amylase family glycosyl hydrolase [Rufibacter tibetensis]|uniref:Alpha-amylase n=1 Tax=Rufibacter tibetensis TaxID=512763 RepID=A0A0P0D1F9_9BACT|nr:alpha-amylase family glycosyl hydrolase [Rufibacter tibetensis]ALJ01607.1 alpha-amylase [Rufibacter tibetensis]
MTTTPQVTDPNTTEEEVKDNKFVIYQMMTRLFGNKKATNKTYGTVQENGVGKFNDITDKALQEIKNLGATHVWYTGVLEHALMTDYTKFGIPLDDADVIKGRAGSPYAIKDYYDVNPDLAVDVRKRMAEFEALVQRTHKNNLKVLIDFVPNHVARYYGSDAKPKGVEDFGSQDDKSVSFKLSNNFYYIPGQTLQVPKTYNPLSGTFKGPQEDGKFNETPAKASGNDVFSSTPSVDDWFETVKLNYGVDYQNNRTAHFSPTPDTWNKMRDILLFWAGKGVDGFRCDMAEMVPVEFWAWVIPQVKAQYPTITFIAEIYNPKAYQTYIKTGGFDFLYDKVGLYDGLRRLMENKGQGNTAEITKVWREESRGISNHMLRFLENHDEQRVASTEFAGTPWAAVPAMTVSATLGSGPVMIYFGQEVGEPGKGHEGFQGEDGRTTIFDYWGVPAHQAWMNGGKFDGGKLTEDQQRLRAFYTKLLNLSTSREAILKGKFYALTAEEGTAPAGVYAYLRHTAKEQVLVLVNFNRQSSNYALSLAPTAFTAMGLDAKGSFILQDLLTDTPPLFFQPSVKTSITLAPMSAHVFLLQKK